MNGNSAGYFIGRTVGALAVAFVFVFIFRFIINAMGKPISRSATKSSAYPLGLACF